MVAVPGSTLFGHAWSDPAVGFDVAFAPALTAVPAPPDQSDEEPACSAPEQADVFPRIGPGAGGFVLRAEAHVYAEHYPPLPPGSAPSATIGGYRILIPIRVVPAPATAALTAGGLLVLGPVVRHRRA